MIKIIISSGSSLGKGKNNNNKMELQQHRNREVILSCVASKPKPKA